MENENGAYFPRENAKKCMHQLFQDYQTTVQFRGWDAVVAGRWILPEAQGQGNSNRRLWDNRKREGGNASYSLTISM